MNTDECVNLEFLDNDGTYEIGYYSWLQWQIGENEEKLPMPEFDKEELLQKIGKRFIVKWPVFADDEDRDVPIVPKINEMTRTLERSDVVLRDYVVELRDVGGTQFLILIFVRMPSYGLIKSIFMFHCYRLG